MEPVTFGGSRYWIKHSAPIHANHAKMTIVVEFDDRVKSQRWQHLGLTSKLLPVMRSSFLCSILLALMPLAAQSLELWQGFSAGMSKQEITSKFKGKIGCKRTEGMTEKCTTQPYLTLGNDKATATFTLEKNKLVAIGLFTSTGEDSCPKWDSFSPDETKARNDCIRHIEDRDQESLKIVKQALISKYGNNYDKGKNGELSWRAKGALIQLIYLVPGLHGVSYQVDKTYGSL